jgi:putative flippase GtrA
MLQLAPPPSLLLIRRLGRFAVVGITGTAIYAVVAWVLVNFVQINIVGATSVAFLTVVTANYVLHYHWTFESTKVHTLAFPQFVVTNVIGFLINYGAIRICVMEAGLRYLPVQVIAIGAVASSNFLLSMLWVFRSQTAR